MKKVWKGFAAAVSAAAIAATGFIGATSANAVVTETASVNFTNWQSGNVVTPYLILNIESENIEAGNTNYVYSVNAANKAAVIAGMNAIKAEGAADIAEIDIWPDDRRHALGKGGLSEFISNCLTVFKVYSDVILGVSALQTSYLI